MLAGTSSIGRVFTSVAICAGSAGCVGVGVALGVAVGVFIGLGGAVAASEQQECQNLSHSDRQARKLRNVTSDCFTTFSKTGRQQELTLTMDST